MSVQRDAVNDALRAVDVAEHYDIRGAWRGRWLRSRTCPTQVHSSDAMGLARDGMWHCWACDEGGDLFKLIALAEKLDIRSDFGRVLEVAAGIAGVEADDDDFGGGGKIAKPPKPERPKAPPMVPLKERVAIARKRAAWTWERLCDSPRLVRGYLEERGLSADAVLARETIKSTPVRFESEKPASDDLKRLRATFGDLGIAVPVRAVTDGTIVDIRVRRIEPRPDKPKIVGMVGGVVSEEHKLVGCYGFPHDVRGDTVIVVEGLADYLTALQLWPECDVLGATQAGTFPLVARWAALRVAARHGRGKIVLVAQNDDPDTDDAAYRARTSVEEAKKDGAADRAVDAATKTVIDLLGVYGVAWLQCRPFKDLNDRLRAGAAFPVDEIRALHAAQVDEDFG
jgi:hypothetical protein